MTKEIVGWQQSIGKAKRRFNDISKMANTGMVWDRESMFALQAIQKSNQLQRCETNSIRDAIINVASIGLSLNPAEKLAYIVPRAEGYGENRRELAVLDISYQGLMKLAQDTGSVVWVQTDLVYKNDRFSVGDINKPPTHECDPLATQEERGPLRGAYCVVKLANGDYLTEVMTVEDIHKVREKSKAFSRTKNGQPAPSGPWVDWYEEMVRKTVVKRAYKYWPKSERMSEAIEVLNQHEGIDFDDTPSSPVNEPAVLLVDDKQIQELTEMVVAAHVRPEKIYAAFDISAISDLPAEKFEECKARLTDAKAAYDKKQQENKQPDADSENTEAEG